MRWRPSRTVTLVGLAVSAGILVLSVASAAPARKLFEPRYRLGAVHVPLYALIAVAVVLVPLAVRPRGLRRAHVASGLLALLALLLVGPGLAKEENRLNSFPTRFGGDRHLAARAAVDPLGDLSLSWPTVTAVGPLIKGTLTTTDRQFSGYTWNAPLEAVAQVPIRIDPDYNPILDPTDLRLQGEWLFDRPLTSTLNLVVIGRGDNYRLYQVDDKIVLLAEDS